MADTKTTPATPKEKKDPEYIFIKLTPALREAATKAAGNEALGAWARNVLAEKLGVTLEPVQTRKKYATKEEKDAAIKTARLSHDVLVKKLMAEHFAKLAAETPALKGQADKAQKAYEAAVKKAADDKK